MASWAEARDWFLSSSVVRHAALAVALIAGAIGLHSFSLGFATDVMSSAFRDLIPDQRMQICQVVDQASRKKAPAEPAAVPSAEDLAKPLLPGLSEYDAQPAERQRIALQALKAQRLECLHVKLVDMYVRNYYGSVLTGMVFGGIAAIALFVVGPNGWAAKPYHLNVLVTAGAIAALFATFPAVFQQSAMVTAHKAQALRYEALLDAMGSHIASPSLVPAICTSEQTRATRPATDKPLTRAAAFIACVDAALAAVDIPFSMDPNTRPDYAGAFGGSTAAGAAK